MTEQTQQKHVIVSGASRGIGRHTAIALAEAGFHVFAGVRTLEAANSLAALELDNLSPVTLDITNSADIAALSEALAGRELQGLVNNAGNAALGPLEFLPLDEIRSEFEVNLFGHIAMIQTFLPQLRAGRGRIINISSISGFIGFPFFGAYAASKFALEGLSDSLRRELKQVGVALSLIQPGNIDTDIWQTSITKGQSLEERFSGAAKQIYGSRFSRNENGSYGPAVKSAPENVAEVVVHAMTVPAPKARYLVGKDARRFARLRRFFSDAALDKRFR
ncbi:SDR family oxidoreductase [Marimonas lutisalis]|uniref:SDR family oxidoreductase n=1 Tax=Marimonas lutisalis TaxID=2545756 RepID=UPI0010F631E8|nr:SDR family oxidoreductase [Marimonas lutisalis]